MNDKNEKLDQAIADYAGKEGIEVSLGFIDKAIGWGLNDTNVWLRLQELFVREEPTYCTMTIGDSNIDKSEWKKVPLDIPRFPPGAGFRWYKILLSIWKWYRAELSKLRHVDDSSDKWESIALSYLTIRACAKPTLQPEGHYAPNHQNFTYVFTACKNAHRKHLLARESRWLSDKPLEDSIGYVQSDPDFMIDFNDALAKLPPQQVAIARLRLFEEKEWAMIGEELSISDRHAKRLFREALDRLRESLSAYGEPSPALLGELVEDTELVPL